MLYLRISLMSILLLQAVLKCTVDSHHKSPVTCIQWTPDGTKLFTGDSEGNVAITVINMDEVVE